MVGEKLVTTPQRSRLMSRVRRSGTDPEISLRHALHRAGYRYRLDSGTRLQGKPDIVLVKHRLAIFVDGCFWHGCPKHGTASKSNVLFWANKISKNKIRDKHVDAALRKSGWRVIRVWEHDVKTHMPKILKRIARYTKVRR